MRGRRMLAVTKESTSSRMTRECFGSWYYPKRLAMGRDKKLTRTSVREFIPLKLASNMCSIFCTEVSVAGITIAVRALNNDSLWLDGKARKLLLSTAALTIVAGVHFNFHLRVKTSIDFRSRIDTSNRSRG
jgi:hypothetical protein